MPKRSPGVQSENDINKQFGARLRFCREVAGRSQTEVGDALGVSFQQIQKYENGTTSISLNRLYDVASFLRISIVKLLGEVEHSVAARMIGFAEEGQAPMLDDDDLRLGAGAYSKQKVAILTAFGRIPDPKVRRSVVSMVEAIAGTGEQGGHGGAESKLS